MAGLVDRKGDRLKFTLGGFREVKDVELSQPLRVPPQRLSEWVDRTRKAKFSQLEGDEVALTKAFGCLLC
jgi:hypothetical protein